MTALWTLRRLHCGPTDTIGMLFSQHQELLSLCLEDVFRDVKIPSETRIPAGTYQIKLRAEGSTYERYVAKYGARHKKGMLWLQNVPNYEWIYIHIGNKHADTAGCLLVGGGIMTVLALNRMIINSEVTYLHIYERAVELVEGAGLAIQILDEPERMSRVA